MPLTSINRSDNTGRVTVPTTAPVPSLLRNRGFLWLWVGQTISQFGGQFSNA